MRNVAVVVLKYANNISRPERKYLENENVKIDSEQFSMGIQWAASDIWWL